MSYFSRKSKRFEAFIAITLALIIAGSSWQLQRSIPLAASIQKGTRQLDEPEVPRNVPQHLKDKHSFFRSAFVLDYTTGRPAKLQLQTNTCVTKLLINAHPYKTLLTDPSINKSNKRYPYKWCKSGKFFLDLEPYLNQGKNILKITYTAQGKPKFHWKALSKTHLWASYAIAVCIALLGITLLARSALATRTHPHTIRQNTEQNVLPLRLLLDRKNLIGIGIISITACLIRYGFLPYVSYDMNHFLYKWYQTIQQYGVTGLFIPSIRTIPRYDYTPTYAYMLATVAYIFPSLKTLYAVKLISVTFDFLLAFLGWFCVRIYSPEQRWKALAVFAAILLAPSTIMNSVIFGQCDVVYTAGLLAFVYFISRKNPFAAMLCWSLACAFKMQAMFFAPFVFLMMMQQRIPIKYVLILPATYILLIMPIVFQGSDLYRLITVYLFQFNKYHQITYNAGNPYIFMSNAYYSIIVPIGISVAFCIMAIFSSIVLRFERRWNLVSMILYATLILLLAAYCLPKMHERYFYPATAFCTILAALRWRFIPAALCLNAVVFTYINGIVGNPFNTKFLALFPDFSLNTKLHIAFTLNTLALLQLLGFWAWDLYRERKQGILPP